MNTRSEQRSLLRCQTPSLTEEFRRLEKQTTRRLRRVVSSMYVYPACCLEVSRSMVTGGAGNGDGSGGRGGFGGVGAGSGPGNGDGSGGNGGSGIGFGSGNDGPGKSMVTSSSLRSSAREYCNCVAPTNPRSLYSK